MFGFGKNKEQIKAKVMTEEFNSIISVQIINAMIVKMIGLDTDQKIATIIFFDYLCHIYLEKHAPREQVEATLIHSLNLFDEGSFTEEHIHMSRSLLTVMNDQDALQLVDECKEFILNWNKNIKNQNFLAGLLRGNITPLNWVKKYYDKPDNASDNKENKRKLEKSNDSNIFLEHCATEMFYTLDENAGNQKGSKEIKSACHKFVRDYRELYDKAEESEVKPYFANLFVATTLVEHISIQDFKTLRTDNALDAAKIMVFVLKLVNVAISLSTNPEKIISWSTYTGAIIAICPEFEAFAKDQLEYSFNTKKKKGDLPFEWTD